MESGSSDGRKKWRWLKSIIIIICFLKCYCHHIFKTRPIQPGWPSPVDRSRIRPTWGWNQAGLKKKQEKKNLV
jgi:hypothetical protein